MSSYVEGQELAPRRFQVTRADLVRYAGASGDRNPIHWSDRTAAAVGLPGVISHGMYTMALAAGAVQGWAGAPGRVREFGAKFTKPVVVPDNDEGVELVVTGLVRSVQDGLVRVTLEVTCSGEKVLGNPTAAFVG